MKFYDTHAHFFSADTVKYPLNLRNPREGEENLRRRIAADPATPARILPIWDEVGVTGGAGVQYNNMYKKDNSYILDACEEAPDRLSPVVMLDAEAPDSPQRLREMAPRKVVGLRLFGPAGEGAEPYPWLDAPAPMQTIATAAELGIHLIVMYGSPQASADALARLGDIAKAFPKMKVFVDHFGWTQNDGGQAGMVSAGHKALRDVPNLFFKITPINFGQFRTAGFEPAPFIRQVVDTFGPEKLMWGSDLGNTLLKYPEMIAQALEAASLLTPEEAAAMLHDNGERHFSNKTRVTA